MGRKAKYTPEEYQEKKKEYMRNRIEKLRKEKKIAYLLQLFNKIKQAKNFETIQEEMMKLKIPTNI